MYFTKMTMKKEAIRSSGWDWIVNAYRRHRLVYRVFCADPDDTRRFVFRFELQSKPPTMWVVSEDKPNAEADNWWVVETKEYNPDLQEDDVLEFQIKVNPTRGTSDGKRHSIITHANQTERDQYESKADLIQEVGETWLTKKSQNHGFDVLAVRVGAYRRETWSDDEGRSVKADTLDYTGLLVIKDVDKFQTMLLQGIGRSKSFGCGMMMIKRAASC